MAHSKSIADCYATLWSRHFTWNSEMGNQLSGIAPSQILSVESYFSDLPDYEFDCRWDIFPINELKQIETLLVNPGTEEKSQDLPMHIWLCIRSWLMIVDSSNVVVSSEFLVFHRAVIQSFSFLFCQKYLLFIQTSEFVSRRPVQSISGSSAGF